MQISEFSPTLAERLSENMAQFTDNSKSLNIEIWKRLCIWQKSMAKKWNEPNSVSGTKIKIPEIFKYFSIY